MTTFLASIPFPPIPPLEKKQKLKGYFEVLDISIFTPSCRQLLLKLSPPHGSGQVQGRDGIPIWQGRGWQALLVDHKDHTQSLGTAPVMVRAVLSQRERRADTAKYVRTAGESAVPQ